MLYEQELSKEDWSRCMNLILEDKKVSCNACEFGLDVLKIISYKFLFYQTNKSNQ